MKIVSAQRPARRPSLGVLVRCIMALSAVVAMIVLAAAPGAAAEPNAAPDVAAGTTTLSLNDLGSSTTISFYIPRDVGSSSVSFPVPPGMTPVALRANVELPVNLRYGNLAVSQDSGTLARMVLPTEDGAEMVIPLAGAKVYGNYLSLTLTMTALPLDGYCWDSSAPVRLTNAGITFAGSETPPKTVSDFIAPVTRRVSIGIPAKPSLAESNAAVQIAAIAAGRYGGQNPDVTVVRLPDGAPVIPGPPVPFERRIVVKEGTGKGLTLQDSPAGPQLLVSGTGKELTDQALLLSDDALRYALSTKADADQLLETEKLFNDRTTLAQLNKSGLKSEALWPQVGIELDQSRFGHPIGGIQVHLNGSYTPLSADFGGEVIVSVGGETVDRWPADAAGVIDRSVTVPDKLVKRSTTVQVGIHTTGQTGHCGEYLPMAMRIDGSTEISVNPLSPPMPAGFQSLPQALMPRVHVGIGSDPFGDTARAAAIMVGLQHSSGVPLLTEVSTLDEAISGSDPAVLVSSQGWADTKIALPYTAEQGRVTVAGEDAKGGSVTLDLDPAIKYGSLQTVFDGRRTLLVATSNGAPQQLDELLRWTAAERGRWSGLNGRALIAVPGSEPVTVPNPVTEPAEAPDKSTSPGGTKIFWWAVGAITAVAAAGAVLIVLRARKAQRTR